MNDLMAQRHLSEPPATYARGRKRLDYALASPSIAAALKRAGYEAFNSRLVSDHRGYYMDFDTQLLFGSITQTLSSKQNRGLHSNHPSQVTMYIRRKHELLTACNAFQRAAQLNHPGNRHGFAERLDRDMLQASLSAEKALPKLAEPAWSLELVRARRLAVLLTKQLSALRTSLDLRETLQEEISQFTPPYVLPTTVQECSTRLRTIKAEIAQIVKTSFERRDDERNRRIEELEKSPIARDKESARRLKKLRKAEELQTLFKKLRSARKDGVRKGVARIEIPSDPNADPKSCTEWVQIDVPTDVLHHLQQRNRNHFGQAYGTPFTIPPIADHLGYRGDGWAATQILDGTYDGSQLDDHVRLLLRHLTQVHTIQERLRPTITPKAFASKLKVWTETTTTSPSGLHLGHLKALFARHSFSSNLPDQELTNDSNSKLSLLCTTFQIPFLLASNPVQLD